MVKYSIYHVSNNGKEKFSMNASTGDLALVGEVQAGEQYSVTLRVSINFLVTRHILRKFSRLCILKWY